MTFISASGGVTLALRAVRNGLVLTEGAVSKSLANNEKHEMSLVGPVTMAAGDTLQMQITNEVGSNINVAAMTLQVG